MFKQAAVLAATGVAWLAGCGGVEPQMEQEEIIANLIEAGYPARDIQVIDEAVFVGGDAHVTLQASREMLQATEGSQEQFRTTNLVGAHVTKICINPAPGYDDYIFLRQGLDPGHRELQRAGAALHPRARSDRRLHREHHHRAHLREREQGGLP